LQPTVGQFVPKPRASYWHATTDSPRYGIPTHLASALHEAASLCSPHGSPGGAGHQSDVLIPQFGSGGAPGVGGDVGPDGEPVGVLGLELQAATSRSRQSVRITSRA
jgi:hypothetical protein